MHIPVLLEEAVAQWSATEENPKIKPGIYVDATFGEGGHSRLLLEKTSVDKRIIVIGIDRDPAQIKKPRTNFRKFIAEKKIFLFNDQFSNIAEITSSFQNKNKINLPVRGILFDFGLATNQLRARRGFSFQASADPLDMRFNSREDQLTAAAVLNTWREEDLARIFQEYGEEKYARRAAQAVIQHRNKKEITTVKDLLEILEKVLARPYRNQKIHYATRIFQALRIAVNSEYENIQQGLAGALAVLGEHGRIAAIRFNSGEDRLVKNFFRRESRDCVCPPNVPNCICEHQKTLQILTRKPLRPSLEEIKLNPSSRSAKLRVAQKI